MKIQAWTDCAIPELGDKKGRPGPIREVTIVRYDGGETADIVFKGTTARVEVGRLYVRAEQTGELAIKRAPREPARLRSSAMIVDSAYIRIKNSRPNSPYSAYSRIKSLDAQSGL